MPNSSPGIPLEARSQERGRPGGDESRARLLATAGELFAERGYNGVSTRELAKAADVNVSAIAYYFRGKKGLYRAVFKQLIEDTNPFFCRPRIISAKVSSTPGRISKSWRR